jgi:hypothetical protein
MESTQEETKITTQEEVKPFVQGKKSETVEKALAMMKKYRKDFDEAAVAKDQKKMSEMSLYEFPKMMQAIRDVEIENLARKEKGEPEFIFEKSDEFKAMAHKEGYEENEKGEKTTTLIDPTGPYGFGKEHIERQRELAGQYKNEKK